MLCRETAFAFAPLGANVILGCRNVDVAKEVADEIRSVSVDSLKSQHCSHVRACDISKCILARQQTPGAKVVIPGPLDLAKPSSIHSFAENYRRQGWPLHLLVNNAGAAYKREWYTEEGVAGLTQVTT